FDQARGGRCHPDVAALAPDGNAAADVVDELVFFDAVLGPLVELRLLGAAPLLGTGDRHKVGAGTTAVNNLVGDALVGEPEMAGRLLEGRVDDRIFDNDLAH